LDLVGYGYGYGYAAVEKHANSMTLTGPIYRPYAYIQISNSWYKLLGRRSPCDRTAMFIYRTARERDHGSENLLQSTHRRRPLRPGWGEGGQVQGFFYTGLFQRTQQQIVGNCHVRRPRAFMDAWFIASRLLGRCSSPMTFASSVTGRRCAARVRQDRYHTFFET
jgi:hypothetical protein